MRQRRGFRGLGIAGENLRGDRLVFGPGAFAVIELGQHGRHRAAHVRPLRRDHLLDRGIAREAIDRAVKIDVERDQPRQRRVSVDDPSGLQRRLELRASRSIGLGPSGRELCCQRVDGAAHLVELADALRVEPGDFKAAAAAFGDEPLPVQQMQRMRHRLARYAELFRQLVLPDAMPGRQRTVGDRLEDPGIDLVDQVGERIQWDHAGCPFGIRNSEFRN